MAFRPGAVDLPTESAVAALATITLPETFGEYDITMPTDEIELPSEEDLLSANRVAHRISITLHQEAGGMETLTPGYQITSEELFQMLQHEEEEPMDIIGRLSRPMTPDVGRATEAGMDIGISPAQVADGRFDDTDIPDMADDSILAQDMGAGEVSVILPEEGMGIPGTPIPGRPSELPEGLPIPQISIERPGLARTPPPEAIGESPKRGEKRKRVTADARGTTLSAERIRAQLEDTSSIVRDLDPAPATKRAMHRKAAARRLPTEALTTPTNAELAVCPELMKLFTRTMTTEIPEEEEEAAREEEGLPAEPTTPAPGVEVTAGLSPITPGFGAYDITDIAPPDVSGFDHEEPSVIDQAAEEDMLDQAEREREEKEREEELVPVESWSERTLRMQRFLGRTFSKDPSVKELSFQGLVAGQPKKVVAGTFFEFLVLKTRNRIDLRQEQPYGDILVSKTPKFDSVGTTPRRPMAPAAGPMTPAPAVSAQA